MPDTHDPRATVRSVLTDTFRVPEADIEPGRTLGQLDLDSLALAELALVLHERLGVRIDIAYATPDTTVDRLAGHLASLCAGGSGAVASS